MTAEASLPIWSPVEDNQPTEVGQNVKPLILRYLRL